MHKNVVLHLKGLNVCTYALGPGSNPHRTDFARLMQYEHRQTQVACCKATLKTRAHALLRTPKVLQRLDETGLRYGLRDARMR